MEGTMNNLKEKFKKSFFFVNKIYIFIIFTLLTFIDFTLGFYYFLLSIAILIGKTLISHLPLQPEKPISFKTYTYKKLSHKNLKIDIWYPTKNKEKKLPLVFFCHGGGWISGFRNQPNNVSWCKFLASKNFCVSSIDYRYGIKNDMEDILCDYSDALKFIRENNEKLNIDTDNIVLMGLSAGGHLSLLYSTYNSYMENEERIKGIKGVVAYYSPSDLNDIFTPENKSLFARFATKKTLKAKPEEKEEIYYYYSPLKWISNNMVPCLIVHGKLDTTVPFSSSVKLAKELKRHNVDYEFVVHEKAGHSFDTLFKDEKTIDILEKTSEFIKNLVQL